MDDFGEYFEDSDAGGSDGASGPGATPPGTPPTTLAGRYELGPVLGTGSHGTVYRARDRLLNRDVALKLLLADADPAQLRRETVALRSLRIVGVVRLLDDGLDGPWPFLVMELIEGQPFGAAGGGPVTWSALRKPAASLFEVLGRVHAAGVLHLDLKPGNVRVRADGSVVLLDLGLASGPALGGAAPERCTGGTVRYMAPEQFASGRVDARSDLYAAGVMIHEALTGRPPGDEPRNGSADGRNDGCHDLPPPIRDVVRSLVQRDPDARPASAWDVRDRLDVPPRATGEAFVPADVESFDPGALESIFTGPERILHLRSDPAGMLHRHTGGARDRVAAELDRWLRLGVAVPEAERLRVDRAALDWLETSSAAVPSSGALDGHSHQTAHETTTSAEQTAHEHLERGRPDRARHAIEQGLSAARRGPEDSGVEARLIALWAQMAIDGRDPLELRLAIYQVGRSRWRTDSLAALESLLRASLYAEQREHARAEATLAALASFADPELELRRQAIRLRVAQQQTIADEEAVLDQARAWAHGQRADRVRARVLGWVGRLRYRQGRFEESALLHEQAVESAVLGIERLSSLLNGASSQMEAGRYETAHAFARDALDLSRSFRVPLDEGRAEWLLRAIEYRMGVATRPDQELVHAAEHLDVPYLTAVIALNEAAIAWRAGVLDLARQLASTACASFEAARIPGGCQAARALALACRDGLAGPGRRLDDGDHAPVARSEIDALARDMLDHPVVDIDWQVLGLVSLLRGGEPWRDDARRLALAAPDPERRRELLAPDEVLRG